MRALRSLVGVRQILGKADFGYLQCTSEFRDGVHGLQPKTRVTPSHLTGSLNEFQHSPDLPK